MARDRAAYERHRRNNAAFRARKKIYNSAAWQETRVSIKADRVWCEIHLAQGVRVVGTEVHHRVDLAKGGAPFDPENLALLCESCHSQITHGGRVKGCTAEGVPLDPNSHWHKEPTR